MRVCSKCSDAPKGVSNSFEDLEKKEVTYEQLANEQTYPGRGPRVRAVAKTSEEGRGKIPQTWGTCHNGLVL